MIGVTESDIILGIQSLHPLGPYIQYFQQMELEFVMDGKKIMLKALVDDAPKVASASMIKTINTHNMTEWVALPIDFQGCGYYIIAGDFSGMSFHVKFPSL